MRELERYFMSLKYAIIQETQNYAVLTFCDNDVVV